MVSRVSIQLTKWRVPSLFITADMGITARLPEGIDGELKNIYVL